MNRVLSYGSAKVEEAVVDDGSHGVLRRVNNGKAME